LTVLDGNFCSFEPLLSSNPSELQIFDGLHIHAFNKDMRLYAFDHKKYSQCGGLACRSMDIAKVHLNKYSGYRVKEELRPMFEQDMRRFYPNFSSEFEFVGYSSSIITQVTSRDVFRGCVLRPEGTKLLHVFAPRLSEIFNAEQSVLKVLLEHNPSDDTSRDVFLDNVSKYLVQPFGFASRISQNQFERVFLAKPGLRPRKPQKVTTPRTSRSPRAGLGGADFKVEPQSITMPSVYVNSKVLLEKDRFGVVRYIGPVEFADGEWFGIELLKSMGAHDGQVKKNGKRYFFCAENRGIFVQRNQIRKVFQKNQKSNTYRRFKNLKDPEVIRQTKSVRQWTVEDVCRWAAQKGLMNLISKLKYNKIDGRRLMYATKEQLLSILRISNSETLALFQAEHLKLTNRGGAGS